MNDTEAPDTAGAADAAPRRPWWHWRRLTRGPLLPALAVAGALLGATGVAWQTGTGPFAADERACWGSLGEDDVAALFGRERDVEASETTISRDQIDFEGPSGQCSLASAQGIRIIARVHRLGADFHGLDEQWADTFLSARLTSLGGRLLGMASDNHAWLAVPEECAGDPREGQGPVVIDLSTGWTIRDSEVDTAFRAELARTVVKLVNGYLADRGRGGTLGDPVPRLSAPPRSLAERSDAFCGIAGLHRPAGLEPDRYADPRVTSGRGPVRTCDRSVSFDHPGLRLMTVEDPRLAALYQRVALKGGTRVEVAGGEDTGFGVVRDDYGVFRAKCPRGR
ncbi:hypothetical protein ACZ90_22525 [Streptomyces albus subsp. albus]|nr:hypothetical protein ACZ90_22525 [Streptomyces albus subsp. albus]